MAISSVNPVTGSIIQHGDSCTFVVDNTYTYLRIKVQTENSLDLAYDTAAGGVQAGYTAVVTDLGAQDQFVLTRDAGWDKSPQLIYVEENETGSDVVTGISYSLETEQPYSQGTTPYNVSSEGELVVSFKGRQGVVVPAASDYDASEVDNDSSVAGATVKAALETLDATYTTDHGTLTGRADDDHTQYWLGAGTRSATALLFDERPDHVNTFPLAGKGELWCKDTIPSALYWTDDAGTDWNLMALGSGDVTGPASSLLDGVVLYSGTTGKILKDSTDLSYSTPDLTLGGADASLVITETTGTVPNPGAGEGAFWVNNTIPTRPCFSSDATGDYEMALHQEHIQAVINTNGTVNQWYSWDTFGPYHDTTWSTASGGTGAGPSFATSYQYPPLMVLPRGGRIIACDLWIWNPDVGNVSHTVQITLNGQALVNLASSAGTNSQHAGVTSSLTVTTPKWRTLSMTVSDASVSVDEGLYFFVRETGGAASRVDMRMHATITYTIDPE